MSKRKKIDPQKVGLHHSVVLEQVGDNQYVIVMRRKSRIIMKDGNAILQKIEQIRKTDPNASVSIETNAPVCSKTKAFLGDKNVSLIEIQS